jgi:hypothetical protein
LLIVLALNAIVTWLSERDGTSGDGGFMPTMLRFEWLNLMWRGR